MILELLLAQRIYHPVTTETISKLGEAHASICGLVTYVAHEKDTDWHITLDNGKTKVILEIIKEIPLPIPNKNDIVEAKGIARKDPKHEWYEIHPVIEIKKVSKCK